MTKRVRNEEDGIVGDKTFPRFNNVFDMPVVRAVAYELLCWHLGTAGGVPHQFVKDDVYNGLFLSATTNVRVNQW